MLKESTTLIVPSSLTSSYTTSTYATDGEYADGLLTLYATSTTGTSTTGATDLSIEKDRITIDLATNYIESMPPSELEDGLNAIEEKVTFNNDGSVTAKVYQKK